MLRNKILYFMILTEVCLLCILYNAYQPVALLWIVVLLPVLLFGWLCISAYFIRATIEEESVVVTRQNSYEAEVVIENHSMIPAGQIQVRGNVDGKNFLIHVYLKERYSVKVTWPVDCERCGVKIVTISDVVLFDYLKIFKKVKKLNREIKVIIVPKVYEVPFYVLDGEYEFDGDSEKYSEHKPGDDTAEIFDIRDYQTGDRLSRVHWKLSMKLNRLMVKEYSRPLPDGIMLLMDTKNGEECIDVLFSVGIFMAQEKRKVWVNDTMTQNTEEYIMEFMKCMGMEGKARMGEILSSKQDLGKGRKIICCLDQISRECLNWMLQMAKENKVYLVTEGKATVDLPEDGGIYICSMAELDVPAAIERIMNE